MISTHGSKDGIAQPSAAPSALTVLLIRHGDTDAIGRYLAGRAPGVHLSEAGRGQAARLPGRLARHDLRAVYASPLERAVETAEPLARERRLDLRRSETFTEVDFGAWTGLSFEALQERSEWQRFNTDRALAAIPGGERVTDMQARAVAGVEGLRTQHPRTTVAVVTHAEIIRSVVLHYLGVSLDYFQRIEISPASVTTLDITDAGPRFVCINDQDHA
jgi:probable phosphoglycerate mutase